MALNKLMSVRELAELLGLSVHTIYSFVSRRRLPFVKVGNRTMFRSDEIERWIAAHTCREDEQQAPTSTTARV